MSDRNILEGLWFHSKNEGGDTQWQGQVLELVSKDTYLVQLYEWTLGQHSCMKIVPLYLMEENWDFYVSSEAMKGKA